VQQHTRFCFLFLQGAASIATVITTAANITDDHVT
jgi:hypothetical protein